MTSLEDRTVTATRSPQILIVENERVIAMSLQQKLEDLGYRVPALATSGEDAVSAAEQAHPDLVLMDIRLDGDMDGIEAARIIRDRLRIPIVYLTACSTSEIVERAKLTEPFGYLLEPCDDRELQITIEMALYRHQMEQRLLAHTRLLAATLRSIGDGVIATDVEGRVTFLNPVAEALTGWSWEQALGKPVQEVFVLIDEVSRRPVDSPLARAMRDKITVPLPNQTSLLARGRGVVPIDDSAAPILDDANALLGGVLVFRDVTGPRQFLRAQKLEAIGRLAAGVAHGLNNLLTVIISSVTFVKGELPPADPGRELLEQSLRASERAAELTGHLLAYGRRQMLNLRVVDLNDLIASTEKLLRRLLGEDVDLSIHCGAGPARIKVDPGQVQQMILNLATNARDAMPNGGRLTIETGQVRLDEVVHEDGSRGPGGAHVLLGVTDTGCGMDQATLAHIFEPFFTTKELGKGTGLGLAIVYGIVGQCGGRIEVESQPGRGTRFKIYFPASQEEQASAAPRCLDALPHGTETVLLVEDEEYLRRVMARLLRETGYTVLEAADGVDALDVVSWHNGRIDLLLTDVVMPRLGGRQLAEAMRALHPGARALFLSGYTDDEAILHGVAGSEKNFLQKPFTLAQLAQRIREVLARG